MKGRCRYQTVSVIDHISGLTPDPENRRRHPARNIGSIVDSLHEVGAARSIVIDEDGVILAGNGVVEAAAEAGIERVQVIEADGETIVAVQRKGLTPRQKARLGLHDNFTGTLAEWNVEQLQQDQADMPELLAGLWRPEELAALLEQVGNGAEVTPPEEFGAYDENIETEHKCPKCGYSWSGKAS